VVVAAAVVAVVVDAGDKWKNSNEGN